MVYKAAPLFIVLLLAGCATRLTDGGRAIRVVRDGSVAALAGCTRLVLVRGEAESFLSSGDYGVIYATYDARNKAARVPGADTLVVTSDEERRLGGEVTGFVYDCSTRRAGSAITVAAPTHAGSVTREKQAKPVGIALRDDVFAKAKKCQTKGGVWIDDRCVIPVD
jgi:hypothetical protein